MTKKSTFAPRGKFIRARFREWNLEQLTPHDWKIISQSLVRELYDNPACTSIDARRLVSTLPSLELTPLILKQSGYKPGGFSVDLHEFAYGFLRENVPHHVRDHVVEGIELWMDECLLHIEEEDGPERMYHFFRHGVQTVFGPGIIRASFLDKVARDARVPNNIKESLLRDPFTPNGFMEQISREALAAIEEVAREGSDRSLDLLVHLLLRAENPNGALAAPTHFNGTLQNPHVEVLLPDTLVDVILAARTPYLAHPITDLSMIAEVIRMYPDWLKQGLQKSLIARVKRLEAQAKDLTELASSIE